MELDWFWELDRKLNELAMDAMLAVVSAALISEGLRFVFERVLA